MSRILKDPLVLLIICIGGSQNVTGLLKMTFDSPNYEEFAQELEVEYMEQMRKSSEVEDHHHHGIKPEIITTMSPREIESPNKAQEDDKSSESMMTQEPEETPEEALTRLQCENPWFWNSFKCVWLDLWEWDYQERTQRNLKTAGILGGIPLGIILLLISFRLIGMKFFRAQADKFSRLIDVYLEKYKPGVYVLPNGERRYYDPTPEEEEALEDLIQVLASVV